MTRYSSIILIILAAAFLPSCEKSINVNVPPQVAKLTLGSLIETGTPIYVEVGKTARLTEKSYNTDLTIKNAQVQIFENDVLAETVQYDGMFGYISHTTAKPGAKYTLKVSAPGYTDVEASEVAPVAVSITRVEHQYNVRKLDGNEQDAVILTFTDPATAGDYYVISVIGPQDSFNYVGNFCVFSPDPALETPQGEIAETNTCLDNYGIFLRDAIFNGQERSVKLYVNSNILQPMYNGTDSIYAHISLTHLPEAYYRHLQSLQVARDAGNNPFSEPVNVYTNVTNGYGIFAISTVDDKEIR